MKIQMYKELNYVMKLLNKEWERSGEVKQEIVVDTKQIEDILVVLAEEISRRTEIHQMCEDDFRHNVTLSHENYILLRMTKKFLWQKEETEKKKGVFSKVGLDKEEYKLYRSVVERG